MKRQPTAEQKHRAEERRERMREICRQIRAMDDGERIRMASRMQVTTVEGRTLSMHNQCMLAIQRPDATIVGGFRQWLAAGRSVRKGEHGLGIWIPRFTGRETTDAATGEKDGVDLAGFLFGTVFDVSQTDELGAVKPEITASELVPAVTETAETETAVA